MQRIAVIGCSGSGKSTLALELGAALDLPVTHLDVLYWQPGWQHPDPDAFRSAVDRVVAEERWVLDGGFLNDTGPGRLARADLIVLFDLPTWLCLWRIHKRLVLWFGRSRPDLAPGCPERYDRQFVAYVADYRRKTLPRIEALVAPHASRLVRIRSDKDREDLILAAREGAGSFTRR